MSDTQARTVWVGDMDPQRIDEDSMKSIFPEAIKVKLPRDRNTGRALGYGFAEFPTVEIAQRVMEKNGQPVPGWPGLQYRLGKAQHGLSKGRSMAEDKSNCNVFIGNLDNSIETPELSRILQDFGDVRSVSIPRGKGIAFIIMGSNSQAAAVISGLHDTTIGNLPVRVTWGRPPPARHQRGGDFGGRGGDYDRRYGHSGYGPQRGRDRDSYGQRGGYGYDDRRGGYRERRDYRDEPYRRHDAQRGPYRRRDSPPRDRGYGRDRRPSHPQQRDTRGRREQSSTPKVPAALQKVDVNKENREYMRLNSKHFLSSTPVFSAHTLNKFH